MNGMKPAARVSTTASTSPWVNTVAISGLFAIGMAGIYFHPMLEVAAAAYIAVAASTIWVFADSPRHNMPRWPWTLGTLALWAIAFPVYLGKTRGWRGLAPGICMSIFIVSMQVYPNLYTAKKHFRRGVIFAGQQRLTKAEEEFKMAIGKDTSLGEARLNLGIIYMTQGLLDAAEKELLQAKDLLTQKEPRLLGNMTQNQTLSFSLSNLAAVYAMRTSEAIQVLERAQANYYYAKAKQYADESVRLDADNVRSAELIRRLKQLESFLE